MASTFTFTVDHMIGRQEVELTVAYTVSPYFPATHWQPEEGGDVEIVSVKHGEHEVDLTDAEMDALQAQAEARAQDDMADAVADYRDWLYDQWRDEQMARDWERED